MRISSRFAVSLGLPLFAAALAGCSSEAGTPDEGSDPAAPASHAVRPDVLRERHRLPRGGESTANIDTLPNAVCVLTSSAAPGEHLTVYSDDDGVARVHLQHVDRSVEGGELELACTDDSGATRSHVIEVQIDDGAAPEVSRPYARAGKPVLPVLDVDPMSLDEATLMARGYPPRPDPVKAPAQYAKWRDLTQRAPTVITPHVVNDATRVHGPARGAVDDNGTGTSNNWSGYVITTPPSAPEYAEIFGEWVVPQAYAQGGFSSWHHSTLWVGIDGWGTPDVVQAGTDQDTLTAVWVQTSSYDAWTEWYPLTSATVSNFPVNNGDRVEIWTWVGTASDKYSPTGNTGWFYLWNLTENVVAAYLSTTAPSGTTFNGHTAEWVMERPTVNGSLSSLANYGTAEITNAWAYDYDGSLHLYTSDTSTNLSMYSGSDLLSTVTAVGSESMQFTWHNYQ